MSKKISIEYLAGFFDGEGCVDLAKNGSSLRVRLVQCGREFLDRVQERWGGSVRDNGNHRRNPKHRPAFELKMDGPTAYAFLSSILPFTHLKTNQIKLALLAWRLPKGERTPRRPLRKRARQLLEQEVKRLKRESA